MVEFVFFLTYNDVTIWNAIEIFEQIKDTGCKFIGFKDVGLSEENLMKLRSMIRDAGLNAVLEIVSVSKEENERSVKMGVKLGVDYMIGGTYFDDTLLLLKGTQIKYFPYIGTVLRGFTGDLQRGTIDEIVEDAKKVERLGAHGIDLLSYRYDGDPEKLTKSVIEAVNIPVIIAGSINSLEMIDKVTELNAWGFTVGTAVLEKKFVPDGTFTEQITTILNHIKG